MPPKEDRVNMGRPSRCLGEKRSIWRQDLNHGPLAQQLAPSLDRSTVAVPPLHIVLVSFQVGAFTFTVYAKSGQKIEYFNVVVSAKAVDAEEELPFHTRCWISAGQ